MKFRLVALLLACSVFLGGCSWMDGSYVSVTPHQEQSAANRTENLTVSDYEELLSALEDIVSKGTESCVINAVDYEEEQLKSHLATASLHIQKVYPLGAYAVDSVKYEVGSSMGKTAVALEIAYRHSRMELRQIRTVRSLEDAKNSIGRALEDYDTVLVMKYQDYEEVDFDQIVRDYAMEYPQRVMEIPQITSAVYGMGQSRVVELIISYQTSRDALRAMQSQVQPVFDSAVLYVSGEGTENQKFSQLYAFLMERFEYTVETSITPAYSLLRHGVGDSRAFATVYAAMCRAAGLECMSVTGTRSGEPWVWNLIRVDGVYYHVDLLSCNEQGRFLKYPDTEMIGYVWDYSAYPGTDTQVTQETESTLSEENKN